MRFCNADMQFEMLWWIYIGIYTHFKVCKRWDYTGLGVVSIKPTELIPKYVRQRNKLTTAVYPLTLISFGRFWIKNFLFNGQSSKVTRSSGSLTLLQCLYFLHQPTVINAETKLRIQKNKHLLYWSRPATYLSGNSKTGYAETSFDTRALLPQRM